MKRKVLRIFRSLVISCMLCRYDKKAKDVRTALEMGRLHGEEFEDAVVIDLLWYTLTEAKIKAIRKSIRRFLK